MQFKPQLKIHDLRNDFDDLFYSNYFYRFYILHAFANDTIMLQLKYSCF